MSKNSLLYREIVKRTKNLYRFLMTSMIIISSPQTFSELVYDSIVLLLILNFIYMR